VIPHLRFLLNSLSLGCTCISGPSPRSQVPSVRKHVNSRSSKSTVLVYIASCALPLQMLDDVSLPSTLPVDGAHG
jgi:hypothetical protein